VSPTRFAHTFPIPVFGSLELKVLVSFWLPFVRLLHFLLLLQNHWVNIKLTKVHTNHPWVVKGIKICTNKEQPHSPRGKYIAAKVEIHWKFLKTSGISRPISVKLSGTNYSWVKGIHDCTNQEPGHIQRGDNITKLVRVIPKISRDRKPEKLRCIHRNFLM
jgi:hypothetical protein